MNAFLLNILLALLWMFMWGSFSMYQLLAGLFFGWVLLAVMSRRTLGMTYGMRGLQLVRFAAFFLRILVKANLQVARDIMTPTHYMEPRFVRYPVHDLSAVQMTTFALTLSLTPGTLSVDVSDDGCWLYVHCMYARDRQAAIDELDALRDRILKEVFG